MKKINVTSQILIALVLAIVVGWCMTGVPEVAQTYIKPFGTIFLNLLKFIVIPLVLLSVMSGVLAMKDIKRVGRLGVRTLIYFTATTIVAVSLGLILSTLMRGMFPVIKITTATTPEVPQIGLMDQIVSFFPGNIIQPFSETLMMQVIVIALIFAFAIVHVGEKAEPVKSLCESLNEVVQKVLSYIMAIAPVGVFCMLAPVVAENGPAVLGSLAVLIGISYFCFLIHAILVYASCVKVLGKMNPLSFFREMIPAMLFAFSSDSSVATLPYNMQCCEKMGVKKSIRDFVLSLGATINMDGVAIYLGVTSVFIATCCGMELTFNQYLAIALSATIASIGTPGIPGGSLALMSMVFASAGIPIEGVAIVAGIDRIVDMGRTTMSITGDASCAVIMQHRRNLLAQKYGENPDGSLKLKS